MPKAICLRLAISPARKPCRITVRTESDPCAVSDPAAARFVACHQFSFVERIDVLVWPRLRDVPAETAITVPNEIWDRLRARCSNA